MSLFRAAAKDAARWRARQSVAMTRPRDILTPMQAQVTDSVARFKCLLVGRRGGKTICAVCDAAETMLVGPAHCLFLAKTIGSAREIMWEPWKALNRQHGWGFTFDNGKHIVTHQRTGARCLVRGIDDREELEKLRGPSFDRIYIDECGTHKPTLLEYLVDEVLDATLMDRANSTLWLLGTPTVQSFGYFYKASTGIDDGNGAVEGYQRFRWTAADNPHVRFHDHVYDLETGVLKRKGWTVESPAFRREYLAEWITETDRRVFRFDPARNVLDALPKLRLHDRWYRVLALDFGVNDATACARLCTPKLYGRGVYVERSWARRGLAPSDAADLIAREIQEYQPDAVVGDSGGIGKAYLQEFGRRYPGLRAIMPAEKTEKRTSLELCSDAFHAAHAPEGETGKHNGLFLIRGQTSSLERQLATLLWDEWRENIADGQDDDEAMAVVYGARRMRSFRNPEGPEIPDVVNDSPRAWMLRPQDDRPRQVKALIEGWYKE